MSILSNNTSYKNLLTEVKQKIQQAQVKALVAVNKELVHLYWKVGKLILERQKQEGWGTKVIEQLSKDLKKAFPQMKGLSKTNLKYMRQFAEAYLNFEFGQVALDQISWYHNITLLQKCPNEKIRLWYAQKAIENGWSQSVILLKT